MGSFAQAADSLGMTCSVQLTEDGRVFHERARDLLADVDDLHSMFANDQVPLRGRFRVDLKLEVSSTDRQVDLVQEGFDCVLRLDPIGDETLIAGPLGKLRMVNAASPAYLGRCGVPRSLEDLKRQKHRAVHFARTFGAPYGWEYPQGDSYARLQLPGALHVNSVQTYEAAGIAGLGETNRLVPPLRSTFFCRARKFQNLAGDCPALDRDDALRRRQCNWGAHVASRNAAPGDYPHKFLQYFAGSANGGDMSAASKIELLKRYFKGREQLRGHFTVFHEGLLAMRPIQVGAS